MYIINFTEVQGKCESTQKEYHHVARTSSLTAALLLCTLLKDKDNCKEITCTDAISTSEYYRYRKVA